MKKVLPLVRVLPIDRLVRSASERDTNSSDGGHITCEYHYPAPSEWVTLNVGGTIFQTAKATLQKLPGSRLAQLTEDCPIFNVETREYRFDRSAKIFQHILDFYRTGELHFPRSYCGPNIRNELEYWGIDPHEISNCCWTNYKEHYEQEDSLKKLGNAFNVADRFDYQEHEGAIRARVRKWREIIWYFLADPNSSIAAQLWAAFYILLVLTSVLSLALHTHPSCRVSTGHSPAANDTNPKSILRATTVPHEALYYTDFVVNIIFTADLTVRMVVCPSKLCFFRCITNWLDITVVVTQWVPFFLAWIGDFETNHQVKNVYDAFILLRICRVFLLFKLARHYMGLRILILALLASAKELILLGVFLVIGMIVFSTFIFYAEFPREDAFLNIPTGFWWAIVTMTTVGYGDVHPTTATGYAVGAFCAVCGMLATGLPIPIIAHNFNLYYNGSKLQERMESKKCKGRCISNYRPLSKDHLSPDSCNETQGNGSQNTTSTKAVETLL